VVTVIVTAPALPEGAVAVMLVLLNTVTFIAAVEPNVTVEPDAKFVPVIVTTIPPDVDPLFGLTPLTVGGATYVKPFAMFPHCPLGFVTVTITAPAMPGGVVAVIVVLLTTTTFVAAPLPNVTVAPAAKSIPVIVTDVPPVVGPWFELTPVTNGTVLAVADRKATTCITQNPDAVNGAQE
jgi:hypothetical protein